MQNQTATMIQPVNTLTPAPVIQIGQAEAIIAVVVFLVGLGVSWGNLTTKIGHISATLKDKIEPDLKDVREKFSSVKDRVETLWQDKFAPAHSPRQLNERGASIFEGSDVKSILERTKNKLLLAIKAKNPKNAYDAEQAILEVVAEMPKHCPEIIDELKNGAFKVGQNIDTVLLVGGIYFRNQIFPELGFSLTDLDKPKIPTAAKLDIAAKE